MAEQADAPAQGGIVEPPGIGIADGIDDQQRQVDEQVEQQVRIEAAHGLHAAAHAFDFFAVEVFHGGNSVFVRETRIAFHHMAAVLAGAQRFAVVIVFEMGQEIGFDVLEFEIGFVQLVVALFAEPEQPVFVAFAFAHAFDHQADGACAATGRMGDPAGQQEHLTRFDRHIDGFAIHLDFHIDFAFELVEQFFGFVVVVVFAGIGPGDYHHDIIFPGRVEVFVGHGRLEQVAVFIDPLLQVERRSERHLVR